MESIPIAKFTLRRLLYCILCRIVCTRRTETNEIESPRLYASTDLLNSQKNKKVIKIYIN